MPMLGEVRGRERQDDAAQGLCLVSFFFRLNGQDAR